MFKRRILICIIGLSVSLSSALAETLKDVDIKLVNSVEAVEYKINAPLAPEDVIHLVSCDYALGNIFILDYGGDAVAITNRNKLVYKRSNVIVVKFAKVQNINFERHQA